MAKSFNFSNFTGYIEILKPVCHGGNLPLSIDMSGFTANSKPAGSRLLPYIRYGGNIVFDTSCLFKVHNSDNYILLYIKRGQCRISGHVNIADAAAGSVILIKKQTDFTFESLTAHFEYSMYVMTGALLDEYWSFLYRSGSSETACSSSYIHCCDLNGKYILDMTANLNNLLYCPTASAIFTEALLIQGFLTLLMSADIEHTSLLPGTFYASTLSADQLPKHVILAKDIIESQYYEPLSLDLLQSQVKINKYQLCRDFTKHLGMPPLKYLNHYRIDRAVSLLVMTDDTIHSIGETVGITNTTHFINLFKTQTGLTPQQYRNVYTK